MEKDPEFLLLTSIDTLSRQQADMSQRDLSRAIDLSLGMTNVLLKRLSQKGLVLIQKASTRTVRYVLTPEGMNELARRTYRYLKGTMKKVAGYKELILDLTGDAKHRGCQTIGLLGSSDIDFIIEYAAHHWGLGFNRYQDATEVSPDTFVFVSESWTGTLPASVHSAHLMTLLCGDYQCLPI